MPSLHAKMQPIHKLLNSVSEFRQTQLHFPRPAKCTRPSFGIVVERHPHTRTCFKLPDSATWRKTKCIFRGLLNAFGHGFSKSGQPVHSSVNFSGAVDCKPNDSHSAVGDAQWDYVATCGLNAQILGRCYASACMNSLGSYDVSQALAGAHSCCRVVASRPFLRCKPAASGCRGRTAGENIFCISLCDSQASEALGHVAAAKRAPCTRHNPAALLLLRLAG